MQHEKGGDSVGCSTDPFIGQVLARDCFHSSFRLTDISALSVVCATRCSKPNESYDGSDHIDIGSSSCFVVRNWPAYSCVKY